MENIYKMAKLLKIKKCWNSKNNKNAKLRELHNLWNGKNYRNAKLWV